MVFLLMAVSDFAFYALLGEKWIPAAPLFSIFILITLTFPQKVVNANIIKIQGDSALYRNLSLLDTVLRIIALLVTMTYSLEMIVVGQVVAAFISAYTYTACCGKRIGFSTKKQYRIWYSIVWKPLAADFVILQNGLLGRYVQCCVFLSGFMFAMRTNKRPYIYQPENNLYNIFEKAVQIR